MHLGRTHALRGLQSLLKGSSQTAHHPHSTHLPEKQNQAKPIQNLAEQPASGNARAGKLRIGTYGIQR